MRHESAGADAYREPDAQRHGHGDPIPVAGRDQHCDFDADLDADAIRRTLMRRLLLILPFLALAGCTTVKSSTVCPAGTIGTSWSSQDSNIAGTLVAAGLSAATAAGFMARFNGPAPQQTTISVSSSYPWGFGSNSGATGCIIPSSPPAATTINNNQGGVVNMTPAH